MCWYLWACVVIASEYTYCCRCQYPHLYNVYNYILTCSFYIYWIIVWYCVWIRCCYLLLLNSICSAHCIDLGAGVVVCDAIVFTLPNDTCFAYFKLNMKKKTVQVAGTDCGHFRSLNTFLHIVCTHIVNQSIGYNNQLRSIANCGRTGDWLRQLWVISCRVHLSVEIALLFIAGLLDVQHIRRKTYKKFCWCPVRTLVPSKVITAKYYFTLLLLILFCCCSVFAILILLW